MRMFARSLLLAVALLAPAAVATAKTDYATAPFTTQVDQSVSFGQSPVFLPDGRVTFGKDMGTGDGTQIYIVNRDGTNLKCFTCGQPAPNNVPAVRPQGDWILFHSWRGHHVTIGSPGFGGLGSALYVQRANGTTPVQLTGLDADHGAGEGEDDYHTYWSPDGKHLVWAHLNWNFITDGGNGNWDIRVADFVDADSDHPKLVNERVVRPANGHYYETQWWAPDGSGFLYTESFGTAMNNELFFCRLEATGCAVQRLTHNSAWDEQAIFTPDMKNVIFMSTRDHPGLFNTWASTAETLGVPADADYLLTLPLFEAGFLQPVAQEATDLYLLNLETRSVRRLTTSGDDGWIVPEFTWDPKDDYLMWVEARFADEQRVPLPPDPEAQVARAQKLLSNPPQVHTPSPGGNQLEVFRLERRTVVGRFG
jgi:Tol biopolymer transport system component